MNNQLWFSRGVTFNDPFDCSLNVPVTFIDKVGMMKFMKKQTLAQRFVDSGHLTRMQMEQISEQYLEDTEKLLLEGRYQDHELGWLADAVFDHMSRSFVHCLSQTGKNTLMWSHYASAHSGFCVRYKKEQLINSECIYKADSVNYDGQPISLIEQLVEPNQRNLPTEVLFKKAKDWQYEEEFRLVHSDVADGDDDLYRVLRHDVDAVDCIIFGFNSEDKNINDLKEKLSGRNIVFKKIVRSPSGFDLFVDVGRV
ncbi:DUF2971 domain-containing protein [Pelagibaculum spongiae]|uniref:DUF2971 domain-containing protein n=1 Tax=Pelagibaculum spongiae TaxID=2080658 RepID=UPI00131432B4|nr:DUF2971 domain-containing protein [Pelagibaculum spongiae]